MKRSSNGTYANFLILKDVLEVNFHPDITLNETVLNQTEMEKKAFILTYHAMPELYDISQVERVQLEGSIALDHELAHLAIYVGPQKEEDGTDRISEIFGLDKAAVKVFQDKDAAREWSRQSGK